MALQSWAESRRRLNWQPPPLINAGLQALSCGSYGSDQTPWWTPPSSTRPRCCGTCSTPATASALGYERATTCVPPPCATCVSFGPPLAAPTTPVGAVVLPPDHPATARGRRMHVRETTKDVALWNQVHPLPIADALDRQPGCVRGGVCGRCHGQSRGPASGAAGTVTVRHMVPILGEPDSPIICPTTTYFKFFRSRPTCDHLVTHQPQPQSQYFPGIRNSPERAPS